MNWKNAVELCRDLQRGSITAEEVMHETYQRIEALNPTVNALVALKDIDQAIELARVADATPVAERGPLHGLPMAPKDAVQVAGFATTWGFVPWANNIAPKDDTLTARMRQAGALFIGRSNMPEFGLGSNTFNELYGKTRNPYDLSKTPGGSSGGAAVALATQMLPLADGSDMGGSLRNPASFCNVVGFRPSIGRTPLSRGFSWLGRLSTTGPMARTVADTALLFSVQAGPDASDPLTLPDPGEHFLDAWVPADIAGLKIAYAPTLNGVPVASSVRAVMDRAAGVFSDLGAELVHAQPDLSKAMGVFQTQRAAGLSTLANTLDNSIPSWKTHAKQTAVWNMEKGQSLSTAELLQSELDRSNIYRHVAEFFEHYDALVLPAAQVPPFDGDQEWVTEIEGETMDSYIDWMTICCAITVTGLPAISVPGGFTPEGLPVGVQIVGKPRGDLQLLRIAHAFEAATEHYKTRPQVGYTPNGHTT